MQLPELATQEKSRVGFPQRGFFFTVRVNRRLI
jgi:hypothetical protein